jgi:hypothetical protein
VHRALRDKGQENDKRDAGGDAGAGRGGGVSRALIRHKIGRRARHLEGTRLEFGTREVRR